MKAITIDTNEASDLMYAVGYATSVLQQRAADFASKGVESSHMLDAIGQLNRLSKILSTVWANGELAIIRPQDIAPALDVAQPLLTAASLGSC